MYGSLAGWWPLLSAPEDYAEEAGIYMRLLERTCEGPCRTVLELGSGGGNNASHMKARFAMTLTDVSPDMLEVSRRLNPECEHIEGDMRTLRLGRTFDAVFVHDAIGYMTSEDDLRRAVTTAATHCRPGGAVLFHPDHVSETFRPLVDCGGHDGDGRALRYMSWDLDPDPSDETYATDYVYLLRGPDGTTVVEHERHIQGLFPVPRWLALMDAAGLTATTHPFEHSDAEGAETIFVARRR